jgi:hypothetical protein
MRLIKLYCAAVLLAGATGLAGASTGWISDVLPGAYKAGQGRLTWFGFKVYDAQLWVGGGFDAVQYAQAPVLLKLTYLRALNGADIAKRSHQEITQLALGTPAQRDQWLAQMQRIFPDVQAGDTLAALIDPGRGIQFFRNSKPLAEVNDVQFAQAFIAIWLDVKTSAPALRTQLLGPAASAGR